MHKQVSTYPSKAAKFLKAMMMKVFVHVGDYENFKESLDEGLFSYNK